MTGSSTDASTTAGPGTDATTGDPSGTTVSVDPTATGGSTSLEPTTGTSTGEPGTSSTTSMGSSSTGAMACEQQDAENNDSEAMAVAGTDATCDQASQMFMGTLDGQTDEDWFAFTQAWSCGDADPQFIVSSSEPDLQVCIGVECLAVGTDEEVSCMGGAQPVVSPEGRPGCCFIGSVSFELNCVGDSDESALAYVRVSNGPDACTDYTINYEIDTIPD